MANRITPLHAAIGLIVLTLIVFAVFMSNPFVTLDDNYLIYQNPAVTSFSLNALWHVFTSYDPQLYIPLTFVSWQVNGLILGMNPWAFHAVNLFLHCANVVLVLLLLRRLSGSLFVASVAAVLFAIHPIQTEAVLWAASRKDLLSGFFFLLSTLFYLRYRDHDWVRRPLFWSIVFFALGLLSKVSVITLPVWLLGIDWLQKRKIDRGMFTEKILYGVLAVLFGIIAVVGKTRVLGSSGTLLNVLLPVKSAVFYLQKFFWPVGLSVIYPYTGQAQTLTTEFGLSIGIIIALLVVALFFFRGRYRLITFGIATYFLLLAPSFTTFWKNGFLYFASDRYVYLASIGFFLIIGLMFNHLRLAVDRGPVNTIATILVGLIVCVMIPVTWAQSAVWSSSEALYRNVVRSYPDSVMGQTNLGLELHQAGNLTEAREHYVRAMELDPHSVHAYFNLAALENKEGHPVEAQRLYVAIVDAFGPDQVGTASDVRPFLWLTKRLNDLGLPADADRLQKKLQTLAPDQLREAIQRQNEIDANSP